MIIRTIHTHTHTYTRTDEEIISVKKRNKVTQTSLSDTVIKIVVRHHITILIEYSINL